MMGRLLPAAPCAPEDKRESCISSCRHEAATKEMLKAKAASSLPGPIPHKVGLLKGDVYLALTNELNV